MGTVGSDRVGTGRDRTGRDGTGRDRTGQSRTGKDRQDRPAKRERERDIEKHRDSHYPPAAQRGGYTISSKVYRKN